MYSLISAYNAAVARLTTRPSDGRVSGRTSLTWYQVGQKTPSKFVAKEGGVGKLKTSCVVVKSSTGAKNGGGVPGG